MDLVCSEVLITIIPSPLMVRSTLETLDDSLDLFILGAVQNKFNIRRMGLKRHHPLQELSKHRRILFQPISAGMYVCVYTHKCVIFAYTHAHYITSWFLRLKVILSHFRIQSSTIFHAVSRRVSDPLNCSCSFSAFLTASRSLSPWLLRAQTRKTGMTTDEDVQKQG